MWRLLIQAIILSGCFVSYSCNGFAMTTVGEMVRPRQGTDQLTGVFGGVRPGNTLVLKMSDRGHVRFLRIPESFFVTMNGAQVDIKDIPLATPIKVFTDNGRVTAVEIMGGTP